MNLDFYQSVQQELYGKATTEEIEGLHASFKALQNWDKALGKWKVEVQNELQKVNGLIKLREQEFARHPRRGISEYAQVKTSLERKRNAMRNLIKCIEEKLVHVHQLLDTTNPYHENTPEQKEYRYRNGYAEGWIEAAKAMRSLLESLSSDEAYHMCIEHHQFALRPWEKGESKQKPKPPHYQHKGDIIIYG